MLVEEELCPIYDTDNEEEKLMPVYDIYIEDVIKEEEGLVGKGGIDGEEDNIEDFVVVANDIFYSMIQTTLSIDSTPVVDKLGFKMIKEKADHEGKNIAGTLIDIPIFVGNYSIISGFSITDDMDITNSVVLGVPFCKKLVSCQKIMERFAYGVKCERMDEE
uniref:Uncharacterized protein n=1 Tax=Tanacetum cinerariifolium TaxID=118510 RepID=A0A6L2LLP7_TANCI|nr:hypothetical protein [Tanacetum cinerariifolium]